MDKEDTVEEQAEKQTEEQTDSSSLLRKITVWIIVILIVTWSIGRFFIWNK
jgi:hypothetical protein